MPPYLRDLRKKKQNSSNPSYNTNKSKVFGEKKELIRPLA